MLAKEGWVLVFDWNTKWREYYAVLRSAFPLSLFPFEAARIYDDAAVAKWVDCAVACAMPWVNPPRKSGVLRDAVLRDAPVKSVGLSRGVSTAVLRCYRVVLTSEPCGLTYA